jgi:hypothetical protein
MAKPQFVPPLDPEFTPAVLFNRDYLALAEKSGRAVPTGHNQRFWELGDTFEIFLRPAFQARYYEFQITPNNHRAQFCFESSETAGRLTEANALEKAMLPDGTLQSRTRRYDYTRDRKKPVISSTSPHTVANFHIISNGAS